VSSGFHRDVNEMCVIKDFYPPTDAQVNCLKNNFKIYIKIDTKTAPTCFGAITPSPKHVGAVLMLIFM
jgi:hypothetical protein